MKILGLFVIFTMAFGFLNVQSAGAKSQEVDLNNIKDTSQQALNNVSNTLNQTAHDVQNFLDPIKSILNSINSIIQQIQQIFFAFGGGQ